MESRARRLFSERCHRNYLCVYRRKRASRHAASSVAVGAGGYRHYIYFDGFYFQNLCPAFGCYGADGNYLCGVFLKPEISGLPGGMVAIAVGTLLGWSLGTMTGNRNWTYALAMLVFAGSPLWEALSDPAFLNYFSVIFPMGIFNVVGSLQNIESAEAGATATAPFHRSWPMGLAPWWRHSSAASFLRLSILVIPVGNGSARGLAIRH